jgi:hypothetical protein
MTMTLTWLPRSLRMACSRLQTNNIESKHLNLLLNFTAIQKQCLKT